MVLRVSRFFGYCFADAIAEKEFFAKNFHVKLTNSIAEFSFDWIQGLDIKQILSNANAFTFFVIEDRYLKNQLIAFLNHNQQIKKIRLQIENKPRTVKRLKLTTKGFEMHLI